jgi:hypothetical protein
MTTMVVALALVPATGAGAGEVLDELDVEPLFVLGEPTFSFDVVGESCTSGTSIDVGDITGEEITLDDPNAGTIVLPTTAAAGFYEVTATCVTDLGPGQFTGELAFGSVIVTKVVEGTAPADAEFPIEVACEDGDLMIQADGDEFVSATTVFGPEGGTERLFHYTTQTCTVSELDDGGAESSSITTEDCGEQTEPGAAAVGPSGEFEINDADDCTQTVTNVFAAAVTPPPAAQPVAVEPSFTG